MSSKIPFSHESSTLISDFLEYTRKNYIDSIVYDTVHKAE
ncbi:hypothetical protein Mucpa_0599 [Mucilaginibacter paludis DSM 18603]|uniref:Uncharacterized protein n=1 Tax=Mucilaginibacter paludis DSM 18603 TaxID=714943 RepID=H1Y454_9SPHI|nr:hypothetical protein Mucpa_0599 [Mucilaginibacter paludis DSM 18603]